MRDALARGFQRPCARCLALALCSHVSVLPCTAFDVRLSHARFSPREDSLQIDQVKNSVTLQCRHFHTYRSTEEDQHLRDLVHELGMQQWALIAQKMPGRNGKQCRERWHNQLDVNLTRDGWSEEEVCMGHSALNATRGVR